MTKRTINCLISLVILAATALSCSRQSESMREVVAANALVEEYPDSALKALESVDVGGLSGEKEKAVYAVSLANARWLASSPEFNDSLLKIARAYFSDRRGSRDKMMCFYLSGILAHADKRYSDAMKYALQALDMAEAEEDYMYLGRIHRLMMDIYNDTFFYESAAKHARLSYDNFVKAGHERSINWQLGHMAYYYYQLGDSVNGKKYMEKTAAIAKTSNDMPLLNYMTRVEARHCREISNYKKVVDLLRAVGGERESTDYFDLAYSYVHLGMLDSAKYYSARLREMNPEALENEVRIALRENDYRMAYEHMVKTYNSEIRVMKHVLSENVSGREMEHGEYRIEQQKRQMRNMWIVGCAIALVTIGVIFVAIVFRIKKKRLNERQVENYLVTLELLQHRLDDEREQYEAELKKKESERQKLEKEQSELRRTNNELEMERDSIESKYKNIEAQLADIQAEEAATQTGSQASEVLREEIDRRFSLISELCETAYVSMGTKTNLSDVEKVRAALLSGKSALIKKISSIIEDTTLSEESRNELESLIDKAHGGVLTLFKETMPALYATYGEVFIYRVLGMSNVAIAFLMGINERSVANKVYQMRQKIKKNGGGAADRILAVL